MDPTSSNPVGQQPASPQAPPPATGGGSRKKLMMIIAAVLVLVVLAVILVVVFKNKGSHSSGSSKDTSLYYDRPGYDRAKLSANVGDPMAIKITASDKPQEMQSGTFVIPACSLLTQDNLKTMGLQMYVNDFGYPFLQNYLDESGKAPFVPDPNRLPSGEDGMGCVYGIVTGKTGKTIDIGVNQPFTATDGAVVDNINALHYTKQADTGGFQMYSRVNSIGDDKNNEYVLRKNGTTITLSIPDDFASKNDTILKTIMANFDDLTKHPKGPSTVTYNSPTFTQSFAKACDLVDNDDMKNLTGVDASPLVQAMWPSATGVADFSPVSKYKTKSNFIRSQCIRTSNYPGEKTLIGIQNHTLRITTTSYENTQAASEGFKHVTLGDSNDTVKKGTGLGDESAVYRTNDDDKQLAIGFRQGRVVVQLVYDFAFQDFKTYTDYVNKVSPVADKVAAKVVNFK